MGSHKVRTRSTSRPCDEIDLKALEDSWRALRGITPTPNLEGAYSMREIAAIIGVHQAHANKIVRKAICEGKAEFAGNRRALNRNGGVFAQPVYRLVQEDREQGEDEMNKGKLGLLRK